MVSSTVQRELREWGRGFVAGLLVIATTFFYTMETWWLGWTLSLTHLLIYMIAGLLVVLLIARSIGFKHQGDGASSTPWLDVAVEFSEIVAQGFATAFAVLFLLGIVEWGDPLLVVLRLGMLEVVPFGFGAALANRLFVEAEASPEEEVAFPKNVAVFALGAVFLAATIAPTAEMDLVAAHTTWARETALVLVTLAVVYLALYELGFKGQSGRIYGSRWFQFGTTFLVYGLALGVSGALLWAYGHFDGATVSLVVQETVVLSFPAAVSGAGAQVVL